MMIHSIPKAWLMTGVMALAASGVTGTNAYAQDTDEDDDDMLVASGTGIPKGVDELAGTAITYANGRNFATFGRPDNRDKMFLLYNVGTGKFLNVGGYWGTHASLSIVPRPFWFQHRSEVRVKGAKSYMRYPENKDEYQGVFAYDFFSLTTLQVGNTEGGRRAHVTYNYLRYVDVKTGEKTNILNDATVSDGTSFTDTLKNFNFHNQRIEAQIDMGKCTAVESGGGKMETLLSFGQDVSQWKNYITDLHIYGFRQGGKSYIRVQPLDKKYNDAEYKSGGSENPITIGDDNLVTIVISSGSILINGVDCMPRNTYADSENHIPVIHYNADLPGEIVKFKTDDSGEFVLDNNGKYIIDQENGKGVRVDNTFLYSGDDLSDDEKNQVMPFFLTSRFTKSRNASRNEGTYMLWSPKNNDSYKYGTVGVFGDRALPYDKYGSVDEVLDNSRWFFEPVATTDGSHLYRMYLEVTDQLTIDKPGKETTKHEGRRKFYLQATDSYVYGNNGEPYNGEPKFQDHTNVEALDALPAAGNDSDAYWKVISMSEYYKLFASPSSEFTSMLDLSFLLSDHDFMPENGLLDDWVMEDGLKGKVRIGYDQYSKKTTSDTEYTDDEGNKALGTAESGYTQYKLVKDKKINHGRYMGVDVKGDATGRFYQDVTVHYAGWYAISCGGMSNAGASLFIQMVDKDGAVSAPVEQPLYVLNADEKAWYDKAGDKTWPYDKIDDTHGMPMYNALVAINDENATNGYQNMDGKTLTARYNTQTAFFIDPNVLVANGGALTLRFGISIPQDAEGAAATADRWTVFDDFHLSFGGYALEPNLILSEDSTNLDYINKAMHVFQLRPMRLKRTFTKDVWNTLVLPVSLTKENFHSLFGKDAKLAQLDHLTAHTVEFVSVSPEKDDDVMLKAFKPYIIKVDSGYEQGKVDTAYTARLANRDDGGKTLYTVTIPAGHYYLESATLEGSKTANDQPYYDFQPADYICKDDVLAKDESGANTPLRAYGILCKNYEGNAILEGRPDLNGAYVMAGGNMRLVRGKYGTRGFRCWFMPESDSGEQTDISGVKVVVDGMDTGTGIAGLMEADGMQYLGGYADGVYNLAGQKVRAGLSTEGLPAGIYIVNGLKYLVR